MHKKYANTFLKKSYIGKIYLVCIKHNKDNNSKMNIRKATLEDLDPLMEIYAHAREEMIKNNNPLQWGNIEPERSKIISRINDGVHYIIENYGKICGGFSLIPGRDPTYTNIDGEWLPEIGYHIKHKYHNMGYASEAAQLVKAYIFKNYTYNALYGYTTKDNIPSIKVMMKNGMSFVKEFSKDDDIYVVYSVKR